MIMSTYDEMVGLDENYCSIPSKNPCAYVPCCEACQFMNQYQFEMYDRIVCDYKGNNKK